LEALLSAASQRKAEMARETAALDSSPANQNTSNSNAFVILVIVKHSILVVVKHIILVMVKHVILVVVKRIMVRRGVVHYVRRARAAGGTWRRC